MRRIMLVLILILVKSGSAELIPGENDVYIRVIDVGAGLCCVIQMPGERHMIYDAGLGGNAMKEIREVATDFDIDLLILSHSDADHIGAVDKICEEYKVRKIIRSGYERTTDAWSDANDAIADEKRIDGCMDINLSRWEFPPGATYRFGDVYVTMVMGFGEPPDDWDIDSGSEFRNAASIVMRLQYRGRSVLFCGDAVGRHLGGASDQCLASEKYMVEMSEVIPIQSDIIIASHHGSDGGSSKLFIETVKPEFVVFSAGHKHQHPTASAAQRFLDFGVDLQKIFRTDLEDDERKPNKPDFEWTEGRKNGHKDKKGDDTVEILITNSGNVTVKYLVD